ncbi:SDR family NAD(P)-dependent oxidoreductase (plasmid) [Rhodococcus opacus]|uniref:SDR family NAD(P)-dependent oxidoreductase n=1 Tax=Rhodococcus opacus TaxID=37919 RepID=UPI00146D47B4|nr:SDR family NAD(P)-dependent oxidoreductase [Rhodococcus opacus]MDV6246966.1 SDR family NAD(P)-dependent oxidoreductase [Rhodococcus opacus]WKN60358.1 SDR family NAD(P)-dependent oxidoreductase [Rhodococcus opacus]
MTAKITTEFGAQSTASDVLAGVDLMGRRAIVTGATSGIGAETARALAAAGANVTLAVRNTATGQTVASEIAASTRRREPSVAELDLADPSSVAAFVDSWDGPLHILVNNAGVMATPERRNRQGWEWQFATNHMGHFQLSSGLVDSLSVDGARVVSVSSVGHVNGGILFDDPNFERTVYDPWVAYSQSKTANVLFAVTAADRWSSKGITVNALNPGRIWGTGLGRYMDTPPDSFDPSGATGVSVKTLEQGAATSVLLAGSPSVDGVTGRYFEDCQEADNYTEGVRRGVADHALDSAAADRLWQLSVDLLAAAGYPAPMTAP